jgi:hypothetical protein
MTDRSAETKAFLIAEGGVDIDERILGRITTPASGPGAGLMSFFCDLTVTGCAWE